ncbi:MAG: type II toxin-antitoxin system VapC family toxin [Bryobacteraceae bacterium]
MREHVLTGPVLIDAGPIVAILSDSEQHHDACIEQLQQIRSPLLTCWPVITEAAWLLRNRPATIRRLLSSLGGRPFKVLALSEADLAGIAAVLEKYEDLDIQLADASLVHLANREKIETIFTLDRGDFSVLRLARGKKIRVVP